MAGLALALTLCLSASPFVSAWNTLGPVQNSSFTWFKDCMPDKVPACGPSMKSSAGHASAAANKVTFLAGGGYLNGAGQGCGKCWHLQPQYFVDTSNGKKFGTPIVVRIVDECTDPGYCDQKSLPGGGVQGNTYYNTQLHFDLCVNSGAAKQLFGNIDNFGRLIGQAQQVDCAMLDAGPMGSNAGTLGGGSHGNGQDPAAVNPGSSSPSSPSSSSTSTSTSSSSTSSSTSATSLAAKPSSSSSSSSTSTKTKETAVTSPSPTPKIQKIDHMAALPTTTTSSSSNTGNDEDEDECEWVDEL